MGEFYSLFPSSSIYFSVILKLLQKSKQYFVSAGEKKEQFGCLADLMFSTLVLFYSNFKSY